MPRVTRSSSPAVKKAAGIKENKVAKKPDAIPIKSSSSSRGQQGQPLEIDNRIPTQFDLMKRKEKEEIIPLIYSSLQAEKKSDKELDIINLSGFIREQPDWVNQIKDKKKFAKLVKKFGAFKDDSSRKETAKTVLKKLTDYLVIKEEQGSIIDLGACDATWQSDGLINSALRDQLLTSIRILEASIPENQMDWNDKNEQVWNLVSPSMYPLVAKRSKMLTYLPTKHTDKDSRDGLIEYQSSKEFLSSKEQYKLAFRYPGSAFTPNYSKHFQWLPSEFEIREDNSVRIASYINNLHPEVHAGLYSVIEEVFGQFIPLFENVLNDLQNEIIERKMSKREVPEETSEFKLAGKTLQVITKFTNILLTPEKPNYPGGNFHTEGLANEKIVATGIYYFSCENITEPRLEFQERVPGFVLFEEQSRRTIPYDQKVGSILTKEGRCLAFPNNLQHRVTPFKLKDKKSSGHRKILAFFLVDPTQRVISTRHVPPQQKSWFVQEIMKGPICFPQEIVEMIVKKLDWPMDFEEAIKHRDGIRKERKPEPEKRQKNGTYRPVSRRAFITHD